MSRLSRVSEIDRDITSMFAIPHEVLGPALSDAMKGAVTVIDADTVEQLQRVSGSYTQSFTAADGGRYTQSVTVRCSAPVDISRRYFFAVAISDRSVILVGDPSGTPPIPEISRGADSSGATIIKISAVLTEQPFEILVQ